MNGKMVIMVVVNHLSKFNHLITLSTDYSAHKVAKAFIDNIVKLHGFPQYIVSDHDKVFTGHFWKELHKLSGTTLKLSSTYHPQTDG